MSKVFVVRNQLGHYWGKRGVWVDGTNPKAVLHTAHEDAAINTLFELSSQDIDLRGAVCAVALSDRSVPEIEPSKHLIPIESEVAAEVAADAAAEAETHGSEAESATDTALEVSVAAESVDAESV